MEADDENTSKKKSKEQNNQQDTKTKGSEPSGERKPSVLKLLKENQQKIKQGEKVKGQTKEKSTQKDKGISL